MCDQKVKEWVELAMKKEDINNYNVTVNGKTNNDEGYLGNITFVTVTGKSKTGIKKRFNLVIKSSKESTMLRKQIPIKEAFEKEIYIYNQVKSSFDTFQKEKGVDSLLDFMPFCYCSLIEDNSELLILEDLRPKGYDVWDRKTPMTYDHVKLVLEAYGKWHGLSLALKNEQTEKFEKLTENSKNLFGYFILKGRIDEIILEILEWSKSGVILPHENDMLEKLQFSKDDAKYMFSDMYHEDPTHQVILHGDCWNNNFIFMGQNDTKKPLEVRIIDWQLSGVGSPVFDISHFIYSCCDTGTYQDIEELLKVYYNSLSQTLELLGINAQNVFSYNTLLDHWTKISRYGLFLSVLIMKFCLCDGEDAPDFAAAAEAGKDFIDNFNFDIKDEELYFKRVKNNFVHYVKNIK